jgi:ribonuclease III
MTEEENVQLIEPPELNSNDIDNLVGTKVKDISLYLRAFTHKSALKKYTLTDSFETLEFMGDSVLGFIITKMLFDKHENLQEGFLTKARTKLVRGATLAHIARHLELDKWVLMDDKGSRNGWTSNDKILEDVFEALVGAIYLDLGLLYAKRFILDIYNNPSIINMDHIMIDDNFKDQLMRYCQQSKIPLPIYTIETHDSKIFNMSVMVRESVVGIGTATTKKQAEQNSAYNALKNLNINM